MAREKSGGETPHDLAPIDSATLEALGQGAPDTEEGASQSHSKPSTCHYKRCKRCHGNSKALRLRSAEIANTAGGGHHTAATPRRPPLLSPPPAFLLPLRYLQKLSTPVEGSRSAHSDTGPIRPLPRRSPLHRCFDDDTTIRLSNQINSVSVNSSKTRSQSRHRVLLAASCVPVIKYLAYPRGGGAGPR
ncbi:hypothetical protein E2C01_056141 [Portunus trituberculatus]|uniref:Uncharacterized protein n=1 Tax=Portunus trituberculatus TaxID=210409 RepID=A0A5B7GPJ8_PORTR|nr:hypothetical protein [Portunus trituberculatus]